MTRFLSLVLVFGAAAAQADDAMLQEILATISTVRDVPVAYSERRMSPLLAVPVSFSGAVEFSTDGTLTKRVLVPIAETVSISAAEVVLERGGKRRRLSMRRDTQLWAFYSGLRAMLAADYAGVTDIFAVTVVAHGETWQLELLPRSADLKGFVQSMQVRGSRGRIDFVRTVQTDESWQETTFHHAAAESVAGDGR